MASLGFRAKDAKTLAELASLLHSKGDQVLNGDCKLSLTTQSLGLLYRVFETVGHNGIDDKSLRQRRNHQLDQLHRDVLFLQDFLQKTLFVKVIHRSTTIQGAVQIGYFASLEKLEIKKVPIHLIEGLQQLRSRLRSITCTRCIPQLQDLFETCGGDMTTAMSWVALQDACLSYNSICRLDSSLRLVPALEALDVSHNNLEQLDNHLQVFSWVIAQYYMSVNWSDWLRETHLQNMDAPIELVILIQKPNFNLEYLTELVHINLGYNQISVIPQFSLSVRTKLTTLILRNNRLEHLEGVEDLTKLQELDVTNNCLSDHSCLDVLNTLDDLCLLCLLGNPLSYHTSHRSLTVQHISPIAARTKFILDGKKLTEAEKTLTVRGRVHTSPSRRPTQLGHTLISETLHIANQYTFSDSDAIAQSLPIGSPSGKRRAKNRTKGRSRKALIAEFESSTETTTGISSQDSSRAPSPQPKPKLPVSTNKEEFEVLREHYGPDWLRAFNNNPEDGTRSGSSSKLPAVMTEDDIYLNDSETGVGSLNLNPEEEIKMAANEGSVFYEEKTAEDNGLDRTDSTEPGQLDIEHGVEWKRTDSEQYEYYGLESEPFIVMMGDEDRSQMFLSVNDRYLLEKDVNGELKEMLDLKLLESMDWGTERQSVSGVQEGLLMPVVRLGFGYVRKDRRERIYIMEDEDNAEEFQKLLQPRVDAKQRAEKLKQQLHCLKCSAEFLKSQARVKVKTADQVNGEEILSSSPAIANTNALYEAYGCPKCGSEMVVEMEVPWSDLNPAGPLSTSLDVNPLNTSSPQKQTGNKPIKTTAPTANGSNSNSPRAVFTIGSLENKHLFQEFSAQKRASLPTIMPSASGQSPLFRSPRTQPVSSGTSVGSVSGIKEEGVVQNGHPPERESGMPLGVGVAGLKRDCRASSYTDFRSRQNSTGSDIAILSNPSEGSVSTLADSEASPGEELDRTRMNLLVGRTVSPILEKSVSSEEASLSPGHMSELGDKGIRSEREAGTVNGQPANPAESPLSVSVCNSMVSSVYENSIQVTAATPHTDLLSDHQANTSLLSDETDGDISIYDSPAKPRQASTVTESVPDNVNGMDSKNFNSDMTVTGSSATDSSTLVGHQTSESSSFLVDSYSASLSDRAGGSPVGEGDSLGIPLTDSTLDTPVHEDMSLDSSLGSDIDFTELDHRLKLHFHMSVLKETEDCVCMLQCDVSQYMVKDQFPGILLITSENFYVFKILPDLKRKKESEPMSWLRCIEVQPHSELQHVDMGLGKQSFRLEFDTDCSSYSFIVRDSSRCQTFLQLLTDFLDSKGCDSAALSMREDDPVTLENLYQQILIGSEELEVDGALEAGESAQPFHYISGYWCKDCEEKPVGFVITETDIYLTQENHQWPLPRLQAPLSPDIKGSQFSLIDRQKINNVVQIQFNPDEPTTLTVYFDDEELGEEQEWSISMVTKAGVQSLVKWIKDPWEAEFGVDLEVSSISTET